MEYLNRRLSLGSKPLDELLEGGIESQALTNFYGPAGAGKTNVALLAAISCVAAGKKVLFIDTEGGFSSERLSQLCNGGFQEIAKNIILMEPKSFKDQHEMVKKIEKLVDKEGAGLIVVDSLVALYKLQKDTNVAEANQMLAEQLQMLSKIAREKDIPVLVTNQIYAEFDKPGSVELVSRDVSKYWSKALIELTKHDKGRRTAIIRKHRSLPEGKEVSFTIAESGLEEARGFKIF